MSIQAIQASKSWLRGPLERIAAHGRKTLEFRRRVIIQMRMEVHDAW